MCVAHHTPTFGPMDDEARDAAVLTLVTGFDYLRKAMPYLREDAA